MNWLLSVLFFAIPKLLFDNIKIVKVIKFIIWNLGDTESYVDKQIIICNS